MKNFTRQTLFLAMTLLLAGSLWAQESNRVMVVKKVIHKDGTTTVEQDEVTESHALFQQLKDLKSVDGEEVELHLSDENEVIVNEKEGETLVFVRTAKSHQNEDGDLKKVRVLWHDDANDMESTDKNVIIHSNEPARPILGIYVDEDAEVQGIKVSSVTEGKGAQKAGIQAGDIITNVDGKEIRSVNDLRAALASHEEGDPVPVRYLRNGQTTGVTVNLSAEQSYSYNYDYDYDYDYSSRRNPCEVFIGVGTHTVDNGVKVDYTIEDTPARLYGVQEDDVILALDNVPVNSQSKLEYERDKHDPGEAFTLTIERNGQRMDINARFKECDEETLREMQEEKLTELYEDIEELEQRQVDVRPILGIYPSDNASAEGLKISSLVSGKGAEIAGLKGGDIITQVDGKTVRSTSDLRNALAGHQPGDKVAVSYLHNGQLQQTEVILSASQNHYSYTVQRDPCKPFIGVYTSGRSEGVRVNGVIEDTPAKFSGVMPNDIILALDNIAVNSQHELETERDKHEAGDPFTLTILRGDEQLLINATFKSCDENVDEEEVEEVVEMAVEDETPIDETQDLELNGTLRVESFNLFPNPAVGKINVLFQAEAAPTTIQVFDASGKVVFTDQQNNFDGYYNKQIDLTGQTPGTYILTVRQKGQVLSKQFVLIPRV